MLLPTYGFTLLPTVQSVIVFLHFCSTSFEQFTAKWCGMPSSSDSPHPPPTDYSIAPTMPVWLVAEIEECCCSIIESGSKCSISSFSVEFSSLGWKRQKRSKFGYWDSDLWVPPLHFNITYRSFSDAFMTLIVGFRKFFFACMYASRPHDKLTMLHILASSDQRCAICLGFRPSAISKIRFSKSVSA